MNHFRIEKWNVKSGNLTYSDTVIINGVNAYFAFLMTNDTETQFRTQLHAPMTNFSGI